jgi:hypothetical protein
VTDHVYPEFLKCVDDSEQLLFKVEYLRSTGLNTLDAVDTMSVSPESLSWVRIELIPSLLASV